MSCLFVCVCVCVCVCVSTDKRVWTKDTTSATLGPKGGEVRTKNARIMFKPGVFNHDEKMKLSHFQPSAAQRPEDTRVKVGNTEIQTADRVVLERLDMTGRKSHPQASRRSQLRHRQPAGKARLIQKNPPPKTHEADVYSDSGTGDLQRVTDDVDPHLETDPKTGTVELVFKIIGTAAKTVYEIFWVRSKDISDLSFGEEILRFLNMDRQPLRVRIHYHCDPWGYPCELLTVIATGEPPEPKKPEDLHDGLFTAQFVMGRSNLDGKRVSSRNHVRVKIEPAPSSGIGKIFKYNFRKKVKPETCRYAAEISPCKHKPSGQPRTVDEWKVFVTVKIDDENCSEGNMALVLKRQVCVVMVSDFIIFALGLSYDLSKLKKKTG